MLYSPSAVGSSSRFVHRKTLQLCKQIEQTLNLVLGGDAGDNILLEAWVESVVPAPHSGRLLVTLRLAPSAVHDRETVLQHILQRSRHLRAEVARSIHRRKVPELVFTIAG